MKTMDQKQLLMVSGSKLDKHKIAANVKREAKKFIREYGQEIARDVVGAVAIATLGTTLGTMMLIQ